MKIVRINGYKILDVKFWPKQAATRRHATPPLMAATPSTSSDDYKTYTSK
jgi:hypothetical protein